MPARLIDVPETVRLESPALPEKSAPINVSAEAPGETLAAPCRSSVPIECRLIAALATIRLESPNLSFDFISPVGTLTAPNVKLGAACFSSDLMLPGSIVCDGAPAGKTSCLALLGVPETG
jgi:hypothetical protein